MTDTTEWIAIQAANKALARCLENASRRDWLAIDTAPKDGTHILVRAGDESRVLYWRKKAWRCPFWGPGPFKEPTHWMPLPAPPES